MFKVLIVLNEVFQTDSLGEACRVFINEVKKMIKNGGCSEYALYEACMIEGVVDGVKGIMNFDSIVAFSRSIGILNEDGKLSERQLPFIPKDFIKQVFLMNNRDSLEALLTEHKEMLARVAARTEINEFSEEPAESTITVVTK